MSKGFGHVRDSGERPLNTLQTSERRICGEKQTVAILSNQQTKVLLAPRFYASGNFRQVIGVTVGVNKAQFDRQFFFFFALEAT